MITSLRASFRPLKPRTLFRWLRTTQRLDGLMQSMRGSIPSPASQSVFLFAVPVLASTKGLSFHSFWFGLAAVAFMAGIAVVTFARVHGTLTLFDPKTTYESYLDLSEGEYKRHQIYWAGENFQHNRKLINRNGKIAAIGAALFVLDSVSVAAWVVTVVPVVP